MLSIAMVIQGGSFSSEKIHTQPAPASGKSSPGQNDNMLIPNVLMISKHLNGTLNQWQISFSDNSKFSTVVSVILIHYKIQYHLFYPLPQNLPNSHNFL
jgi:hypothetical protein